MSIVYLLRHADANPQQINHTDAERTLTDIGQQQCHVVAQFLKHHRILPRHIWTSHYQRTEQTAKAVAKDLASSITIHAAEWLALGESSPRALSEIALLAKQHEDIFLVSHEPNLSEIISLMLGANVNAINVQKSSLTAIKLNTHIEGSATLLWSVPPSMMNISWQ